MSYKLRELRPRPWSRMDRWLVMGASLAGAGLFVGYAGWRTVLSVLDLAVFATVILGDEYLHRRY
jgi:hypothetical protein